MDAPALAVVTHRAADARWEMVSRPPHAALAGLVRRYTAWDEWTAGPMRRRELPSVDVPVILNLGPPFRVRDADAPEAGAARHRSFVAGLHDRAVVTEHPGASRGIQADLTPIGARMLLGHPMHALAHRVVEIEDVLGPAGRLLVERLGAADGWDDALRLLDAALIARAARARPPAADVAWAWRRLDDSAGRVGVRALADEIGCSPRHLQARFRDEIGLAPKLAARIRRFEEAVALGEIAARCGYYDQAHLARDVTGLAGMAPGALVARRLPDAGGVAG